MSWPYARRVARQKNAFALGENWRSTVALLGEGLVLVGIVLCLQLWLPGLVVGLAAGFVVGVIVMTVTLGTARMHTWTTRGSMAEHFTSEALKRRGWVVLNGLDFDGHDVDHVLVTPAAVFAVETKIHFEDRDPIRRKRRREDDRETARRRARTVSNLLHSRGVDVDVYPLLVRWGAGSDPVTDGLEYDDRLYEIGPEAEPAWRDRFNQPRLDMSTRKRVERELREFQRAGRRATTAEWGDVYREFKKGVASERSTRRARKSAWLPSHSGTNSSRPTAKPTAVSQPR